MMTLASAKPAGMMMTSGQRPRLISAPAANNPAVLTMKLRANQSARRLIMNACLTVSLSPAKKSTPAAKPPAKISV
jgi:hypothetical protein